MRKKNKNYQKKKSWNDRRSKKLTTKKGGNGLGHHNRPSRNGHTYSENETFKAPRCFLIKENHHVVVGFFERIIEYCNLQANIERINLDLRYIEEISTDSILYLLGFMRNLKTGSNSTVVRAFAPLDEKINEKIARTGFFKYIKADKKYRKRIDKSCFNIKYARDVDGDVAREIQKFIIEQTVLDRVSIKFVYNIVIELMTNTRQHAYTESDRFVGLLKYWYIFVEIVNDKILFTFLDTGSSIPGTIRKRMLENFSVKTRDDTFINEALDGKHRTSTKKTWRGKGLPTVKDCFTSGKIRNLTIISRSGYCEVGRKSFNMGNKLHGTLFYWEVDINELKG